MTGLSGAGKSTLASGLASELRARGLPVEVLDGDEVRRNLSHDLGFSKADRDTQVQRIGYVAELLTRNGIVTIVAAVSPYAEARRRVREQLDCFVEVHVDCPMDELIRRDVKGLYHRALAGELDHFTGISDPYEAPETPEVHLDTSAQSKEESLAAILGWLESRRYLPVEARRSAGR